MFCNEPCGPNLPAELAARAETAPATDGTTVNLSRGDSCENQIFVEVCNFDDHPVTVIRDNEMLGCVKDAQGGITGRVFARFDEDNNMSMLLIATDGSVTDPYVGSWEACGPNTTEQTVILTVEESSTFTAPVGVTLTSWSVRAMTANVDLEVNGQTITMEVQEVIQSSSQDAGNLTDTFTVTTGVGETARIVYTHRS